MAASYKYIFNRSDRLKKNGTAQVQLRVFVKRKITYINSDIFITSRQWSEKDGGTIIRHHKSRPKKGNRCLYEIHGLWKPTLLCI